MSEFRYVTLGEAMELIQFLGIGPVRDLGLLDCAMARPRSSAFGQDAYGSVEIKASALLQSLTKNHSLVDGNKRLAWLATTTFLKLNGCSAAVSDEEAFRLMWELASGAIELDEIASRLRVKRDSEFH